MPGGQGPSSKRWGFSSKIAVWDSRVAACGVAVEESDEIANALHSTTIAPGDKALLDEVLVVSASNLNTYGVALQRQILEGLV